MKSIINWLWRYSSLEWVWSKFQYKEKSKPLPSGVFWLIGLYISIFTFSNLQYQNSINTNENQITYITHLSSQEYYRMFFKELITTYILMDNPIEPVLFNPLTSLKSIIGYKQEYTYGKARLRNLLDEVRLLLSDKVLVDVDINFLDLSQAKFVNSNLTLASLDNSRFVGADFSVSNLAGASARHSNFSQSLFIGSNLASIVLENSYLLGVNFDKSHLVVANLSDTYLRYLLQLQLT